MPRRPAQVTAQRPLGPFFLRWPPETDLREWVAFFPKTLEAKEEYLEHQVIRRHATLQAIMTSTVFTTEEKVWKVMSVSHKWRVMDEVLEERCPMEGPHADIHSPSYSSGEISRYLVNDMAYWYVGFWDECEHPELQTYRWCKHCLEFCRDW